MVVLVVVAAELNSTRKFGGSAASGTGRLTGRSETAAPLAKLREAMMDWYCPQPGNQEVLPCQTYRFLKDLRATPTAEEKKKKIAARSAVMKSKSAREKMEQQKMAKQGYVQMYRAYCAQVNPTLLSPGLCYGLLACSGRETKDAAVQLLRRMTERKVMYAPIL